MMMTRISLSANKGALSKLSESDFKLQFDGEDIRGWQVVDPKGDEIGIITDLLIDDSRKWICFLEICSNERNLLIPVNSIVSIANNFVTVD